MIDVIGRPLEEAKKLLAAAGIEYNTEYSCPVSRYFTPDTGNSYVIRQKEDEDGRLMLIISDKLRKEVS